MKTQLFVSRKVILLFAAVICLLSNAATGLYGKIDIKEIVRIAGPQFSFSSLIVEDSIIYIAGTYDEAKKSYFWSGGLLIKAGVDGGVYFTKRFDADSVRISPKTLRIDNEDNIVILSDISIVTNDYFYAGQKLDLRKFTTEGTEIYDFSDSTAPMNTEFSYFCTKFDLNRNPVVIHTPRSDKNSPTVCNNYDATGNFLKSTVIDTAFLYGEYGVGALEPFEVLGITENHNGLFYCYGERQVLHPNHQGGDTMSCYIMGVDSSGKTIWKQRLYSESHSDHGIYITSCNIMQDGCAVLVGVDILKRFILKIDENGNILWKKFFGTNQYFVLPEAVIETSGGNFLVAGRAGSTDDGDRYVAKLNGNGELIWEDREQTHLKLHYCNITELEEDKYILISGETELSPNSNIIISILNDKNTAIQENCKDLESGIFPNPVKDFIYLDRINNGNYSKIQVFTSGGLKISEFDYSDKIDLSGLLPGLYILKAGDKSYKFIKAAN